MFARKLFVSFGWKTFFPVGTPSLAEPLTISSVLETISRFSYLPTDVEITLEANPTSAETGRLRYSKGDEDPYLFEEKVV